MYIIGVVVFVFGVCLSMFFKHIPLGVLFNPAAIALILFSLVGVIVASSGYKSFIAGLNAVFSKKYVIDDDARHKAVGLFSLLSKTAVCASLLCLLAGIIAALGNSPNMLYAIPALGAALVSPLLGLVICLAVFEPAVYILKHRKVESAVIKFYPKHISDKLLELCNQNGITEEDILKATDITLKKD